MGGGPGFPEMSEISMSSVKIFLSCFSLDGLFIVEKNMIFGIVSIKTYNKIKKVHVWELLSAGQASNSDFA